MTPLQCPIRFEAFLRPMVWGGRALEAFHSLPTPDPFGESWEVSDHPLHVSRVASTNLAGVSLRTLMEQHQEALLGQKKHPVFPWLIKFLDAADWLSVQVHPDEEAVRRLWPGEGPKTEAWFVVDAQPGSRIYAGLLPGVGPAEFRSALERGQVIECLPCLSPRPGDCLFYPAGTVHAVGGGVLLAEIQQTSDATFRLHDWNRRDAQGHPRKLHIEEGLASIHWDQGQIQPIHVNDYQNPTSSARFTQTLVHCPYFQLDYVRFQEPSVLGGTGRLQALIVLQGQGQWHTGETCRPGQVWILPAAMKEWTLTPKTMLTGLLCTLPEPPAAWRHLSENTACGS